MSFGILDPKADAAAAETVIQEASDKTVIAGKSIIDHFFEQLEGLTITLKIERKP